MRQLHLEEDSFSGAQAEPRGWGGARAGDHPCGEGGALPLQLGPFLGMGGTMAPKPQLGLLLGNVWRNFELL